MKLLALLFTQLYLFEGVEQEVNLFTNSIMVLTLVITGVVPQKAGFGNN